MSKKTEVIVIRCRPETRRRLRVFKERYGFRNLEEAIVYLLDYHEGRVSRYTGTILTG